MTAPDKLVDELLEHPNVKYENFSVSQIRAIFDHDTGADNPDLDNILTLLDEIQGGVYEGKFPRAYLILEVQ